MKRTTPRFMRKKHHSHDDNRSHLLMGEMHAAIARMEARNTEMHAAIARMEVRDIEIAAMLRHNQERLEKLQSAFAHVESSPIFRMTNTLDAMAKKWLRPILPSKHECNLQPMSDLVSDGEGGMRWRATGLDPWFLVTPRSGVFPTGWVLLDCHCKVDGNGHIAKLYIDSGTGFSETEYYAVPLTRKGTVIHLFWLPKTVRALRFDPTEGGDAITLSPFVLSEVGAIEKLWRMRKRIRWAGNSTEVAYRIAQFKGTGGKLWPHYFKPTRLEQRYFEASLLRAPKPDSDIAYRRWLLINDTLTDSDRDDIRGHIKLMTSKPLISVLMPTYNTQGTLLRCAIDSVRSQLYEHWELCIADDASTRRDVREILNEYAAIDTRIKVAFREQNGHISAASNTALELVQGEFVALLDHDDELTEDALYRIAVEIENHPDADIIYSDEDKIDVHGQRCQPHFKPDWNPELLYAYNYVSHLGVYRTSLVREVGAFREGYEGSQDYDLLLRVSERTATSRIRHIPEILYHWRITEGSTSREVAVKSYAIPAGLEALRSHFARTGRSAEVRADAVPGIYRVRYLSNSNPAVSLIIPTRNALDYLKKCIGSILKKTLYQNYEIIIVDNQSDNPETLRYLERVASNQNIRVLRYDHPFNYSAINNFAVREANGDLVGLINNDVEVIEPNWLGEMVSYATQPEIGAVGAKLLYGNGLVQHAGVIVGLGGVAGHAHKFYDGRHPGFYHRAQVPQAFSAVTAACLIVRKVVYEEVGGFNEENLAVAFNDVDFCLKIREAGYRNIWTPRALLYHHESISRGEDTAPEKRDRFMREIEYMKQFWGERLVNDPYYNPNLTYAREDFSFDTITRVVPAWKLACPPQLRTP